MVGLINHLKHELDCDVHNILEARKLCNRTNAKRINTYLSKTSVDTDRQRAKLKTLVQMQQILIQGERITHDTTR